MRELTVSDIARSIAGRDSGRLFFVLETSGGFAFICDGKLRKAENPKRKRLRHLEFIGESDLPAAVKIRNGESVTNCEIRKALTQLRAAPPGQPRRS